MAFEFHLDLHPKLQNLNNNDQNWALRFDTNGQFPVFFQLQLGYVSIKMFHFKLVTVI